MNDPFSSWLDILVRVPQGSIVGSFLFNIFLCDVFLVCNNIELASYPDDNTPCCNRKTPEEVISQLEKSSKSIFEWFENNGLKGNLNKCHLLLSKNDNFEANINKNRISNTIFEELLGVTFDNQLNLNHYISKICKTASNRLDALTRVSLYMNQDKRRILFDSYFLSQFNYCLLIWMNHNKSINKKINNLHERALRLIYCDHSSTLQELFQRDSSLTIHQTNIQALAIMMYKVVNNITFIIVSELFSFTNVSYSLGNGSQLHQPSSNTVWNGQETILYLEPKFWKMVPKEMKQKSSLFTSRRISSTRFEKLLGVTFDNQLNFNHHISKTFKTSSNKLHSVARVPHYVDEDRRRILFNLYFLSQFNCYPLIWMNHNKSINQ